MPTVKERKILWNPREFIEDLKALGFTHEEAVAEARAEAAKRRETAVKSARRINDRYISEGKRSVPYRFKEVG